MKNLNDSVTKSDSEAMDSERAASGNRRDFLKKAGKFAVYTPPAVMMLMQPGFATGGQKGSWMGRPDSSYKPSGQTMHIQSNYSRKPAKSWKAAKKSWKPNGSH